MNNLIAILLLLLFWGAAAWALKTGRVSAKGHVIRRAEYPLLFFLMVGLYIIFGFVVCVTLVKF